MIIDVPNAECWKLAGPASRKLRRVPCPHAAGGWACGSHQSMCPPSGLAGTAAAGGVAARRPPATRRWVPSPEVTHHRWQETTITCGWCVTGVSVMDASAGILRNWHFAVTHPTHLTSQMAAGPVPTGRLVTTAGNSRPYATIYGEVEIQPHASCTAGGRGTQTFSVPACLRAFPRPYPGAHAPGSPGSARSRSRLRSPRPSPLETQDSPLDSSVVRNTSCTSSWLGPRNISFGGRFACASAKASLRVQATKSSSDSHQVFTS
ncbi:hypothetical protein Mal4_12710 [Maioricimonas rarisocia]|uniref:Uncharacterized protein n=1 Tax=Maioricimonas rarisocia TaxID=2528026 RepID=A0A517Z3D2_9PLAN|nr:hypothetical protein Mal4_12710 [Maioricimonas rarisocia]